MNYLHCSYCGKRLWYRHGDIVGVSIWTGVQWVRMHKVCADKAIPMYRADGHEVKQVRPNVWGVLPKVVKGMP